MVSLKHVIPPYLLVTLCVVMWRSDQQISAKQAEQDGSRESVAVNGRRPLAEAVRTLEQRHGIVITYEDPPYRHDSQRLNASIAGQPPSFVPRGGRFSFEYVLPQRPSALAMKPVLTAVLRQYYATGYAGKFELVQTGEMFHIVPVSRRAENGLEEPYDALLSTALSFVATGTEPSAVEVLTELTENLHLATGTSVALGTIPVNLLNSTKVKEWSGTASARSELIRILASTGRRLSWQLFYGANGPGMFVLNVHMV